MEHNGTSSATRSFIDGFFPFSIKLAFPPPAFFSRNGECKCHADNEAPALVPPANRFSQFPKWKMFMSKMARS